MPKDYRNNLIKLTALNQVPEVSDLAKSEIRSSDIVIFGSGTQFSSLLPTYKILGENNVTISAKSYMIGNVGLDHDILNLTHQDIIDTALTCFKDQYNLISNIDTYLCVETENDLKFGKSLSDSYKGIRIIKNDKFMTWLTTVTSHQPYGSSTYGDKYLYLFDGEEYDDYNIKLKRYMSKLKVLDDGLGVLLEGLEKQDKLDDTVIILYGDHYPYGLANNILETALPYSIEERYENERVPFVIWSNDIEATTYTEYTSYVNLLPTVANLFNLDYDSRFSTGQDLFSNKYESITIFADGSWKNEYAFYNASNDNITYYTNKTYTIEEIIEINEKVNNKIKYSNLAIQHDYFNYLYKNIK